MALIEIRIKIYIYPIFYSSFTARKNLVPYAKIYGLSIGEIDNVLEIVGLGKYADLISLIKN